MTPATIPATSLTLLLSYLTGAVPFGYLVARARGIDIFKEGSGNIGATNVGRVLGRKFGILVFLLDFAKGAVPVAVASWAAGRLDLSLPPHTLPVLAGLAAFLGHLFPLYLNFRGGKGVATGAGVVAFLLPLPALGAVLVWLAVVCATRYVSLASLLAVVGLCVIRLATAPSLFGEDAVILNLFCLLAAGLVVERHRANITRLLHGNENQLKDSPAMQVLTRTVHVLAMGLWFGMAIFFSLVAAVSLFGTFETEAIKPARAESGQEARPVWFPLPDLFDQDPAKWKRPASVTGTPLFPSAESVRKEQGSRAAGAAVGPLFDWYFLLQGICGLLAVAPALAWSRIEPHVRAHKLRAVVLLVALATVVGGWPLERTVSALRQGRNDATDVLLQTAKQDPAGIPEDMYRAAVDARTTFGTWHLYSLLLNFATLGLVTVGMALTARLPGEAAKSVSAPTAGTREAAQPQVAHAGGPTEGRVG
jgi:acyl-phosphate glycerol 3-phosphate acyltransferase